ncbi:hypothetical protein X975_00472, partial [Stegodyphus mimosarum]
MAASVTARVHIMFKALLIQLFDLYRKLHPWCEKLKRGDWKWPEILELPDDLEAWLKPEESAALKPISIPKEKVDFLTTFFKKIKSKENDSSTTSPIDLENEKPDEDCVIIEDGNSTQVEAFDIGEIITREDVRTVELNEAQDILLHKICSARVFKDLKKLWDNIDIESQNSLPKKLTAKRTQFIENLFSELQQNVDQTKFLQLAKKRKSFKIISLIQLAGFKFAKRLGLVKSEEQYLTFHVEKLKLNSPLKLVKPIKRFNELPSSVINEIKPVKKLSKLQSPPVSNAKSTKALNKLHRMALKRCETIKTVNQLRELYEEIYRELKQMKHLKKRRKLKKIYESRINDIEHIKQN